jgi:hypothetical protein
MSGKALVLDANILIRAVLGKRVRELILENTDGVKFFAPDVAYAKRLGKAPLGMPAFGARMLREDFARKETKHYNCFVGLTLKATT